MTTTWDEVNSLPHPLTTAGDGGATFPNPPGAVADYSIGGIEFLSAASDQYPYQRTLAPQVKEQFDNSPNPGDNSLQGWWVRSQTDWSMGAGQEVMEPVSNDTVTRMFQSSAGVDVFTRPGFVSLLPKAVEVTSSFGAGSATPRMVQIPNGFIVSIGANVYRYQSGSWSAAKTAAGTVTGLTIAGPYCVISSINNVEFVDLTTWGAVGTAFTCTGYPETWWVKSRVMIAVGDKLYEHPGSAFPSTIVLGDGTLGTQAPYTDFKDSTLSITGMTATPSAILLSTKSASKSEVFSIGLDNTGALPTGAAPVVAAEFPTNEEIYDIAAYLGAFIGIATSRGVRIGTATAQGGLVYGPLIGAPVASVTTNVFTAYDRFLQYPTADAGDGRSGLVRLDLSGYGDDARAPWSTWMRAPVGDTDTVTGHVVTGEREAAFVTDGYKVFTAKDANGLEATGWIQHSQVRYGTLETKVFDTVRITTEAPLSGTIGVASVEPDGTTRSMGGVTPASGTETTLRVPASKALSAMAVKVTLRPDAVDDTKGPVLAAWAMRSYPAVSNRSEIVVIPLLNFDFERDSSTGTDTGYEGRAWDRYKALRDRMAQGTKIMVKELNSGASYLALPDDLGFVQTAPGNRASGFGGIVQVRLRTLS